MTTRLAVYQAALIAIGETPIVSLDEQRESRRRLDSIWDGGAIDWCLEQAQWKFATRSVMLDYDTTIVPEFGYRYVVQLPEDHVRTVGVWSDAYFRQPFNEYREESGPEGRYMVSDLETLFVSYVSNHEAWGYDLGKWPASFVEMVTYHLAYKVAPILKNDKTDDMLKLRNDVKTDAMSKDALQSPTRMLPMGGWARARLGGGRWNSGE